MSELTFSEFVELVVRQDVRPERPDEENAPYLSDAIWELAVSCWVKDPKCRPTASAICDTLSHLLDTTTITPSGLASNLSSTSTIVPPPTLHVLVPPSLGHNSNSMAVPNIASHLPDTTTILQPVSILSSTPPIVPPPLPPPQHVPIKPDPERQLSLIPNLTLRGHTKAVNCATYSHDGKYIVSGSSDNKIMVWDAQTGNLALGPLEMHTHAVHCVAFSLNGRQIASGSLDNTIIVWDAVTGKVDAGPFKGHTEPIGSVSFSPDGQQIASGSWDDTIRVWDAQTGDLLIGPLTGHTNDINSIVFSMDGKILVSGSDDKTVRVWIAESGQAIHGPLMGHTNSINFVAISSCGERIVSAEWNGDVCVWDIDTGALVCGPSKWHMEGTSAVVFTPSGTSHCAVSPDGKWIAGRKHQDWATVGIWNLKTGWLVATYSNHTETVYSVCFSPDSKQILTTSADKTIRVSCLDF